ncbi:DNA glycosylase [Fomes fomentarius]|nr:DNA glycosylase [Fomes fomentarius]
MTRSGSLLGRPSQFSTRVTIYEPTNLLREATPRRSKRLRNTSDAEDAPNNAPQSPKGVGTGSPTTSPSRKRVKVAKGLKTERQEELASSPSEILPKPKPVPSPRKTKRIPTSLETPHPAPLRWRETYDTIKRMRGRIVAPVDTMGCDRAQLKEAEPKNQRFSTLVSLMLSSQTKDEVTDAAVARLRAAVGGTLSVDAILTADESAIAESICKVGFWRRKTQYIRQAAERLRDEFDSDVPKTVDELCSLPGVGPKMAFLTLQVAWKLNAGIGVDVHVHRITNRLGWHKPPSKTPEETRLNLQSWLPQELHPEINHLLVGFGQTICAPIGPKCDQCELSDGLCPSARKVNKGAASKSRSKKVMVSASTSDMKAGPEIEVKFEEEEHKVEVLIRPASALTPPKEADHVKAEDTS